MQIKCFIGTFYLNGSGEKNISLFGNDHFQLKNKDFYVCYNLLD